MAKRNSLAFRPIDWSACSREPAGCTKAFANHFHAKNLGKPEISAGGGSKTAGMIGRQSSWRIVAPCRGGSGVLANAVETGESRNLVNARLESGDTSLHVQFSSF